MASPPPDWSPGPAGTVVDTLSLVGATAQAPHSGLPGAWSLAAGRPLMRTAVPGQWGFWDWLLLGRQSPRVGLRVDWSTASSGKGPSLGVLWVRCFRAGRVGMGDSGGGPALRPPSSTYRHRAWEGTPWGAATSRPLVQPLPCASQIKPSPSLLDTTHHCSTPVKASDTWAFPPGVREGLVLGEYGEGGSTSEGTWDGLWP